jgi:hypothetical protein
MCDGGRHEHEPGTLSASLANWRQPGPLRWKLRRLVANMTTKAVHLQACCGRPGEPGC